MRDHVSAFHGYSDLDDDNDNVDDGTIDFSAYNVVSNSRSLQLGVPDFALSTARHWRDGIPVPMTKIICQECGWICKGGSRATMARHKQYMHGVGKIKVGLINYMVLYSHIILL